MRFRTHLLASAIAGVMLFPRKPKAAALVAVSGVAIDFDHYVLYASRSGDWSLLGALRYDGRRRGRPRRGDTRPRYGPLRSVAHRARLTLPLAWTLAQIFPQLTPVALGLTLHLTMDKDWPMLLDYRVWRRSGGRCERCGERKRHPAVYNIVLPKRGGDFWALANRALWCQRCAKGVRKLQGEM